MYASIPMRRISRSDFAEYEKAGRTLAAGDVHEVHRSYIVNLRKITEVSRLRIIFNKNIYIPVGDNYKERFTEYINKICVSS